MLKISGITHAHLSHVCARCVFRKGSMPPPYRGIIFALFLINWVVLFKKKNSGGEMKNVSDVQPRSLEAFITLYFFSKTSFLPLDSLFLCVWRSGI